MALGYWSLDQPARQLAVISDDGRRLTYGELRDLSDRFSESLGAIGSKTFGVVICRNTPECLAAYLGALRSQQAVCLLDGGLKSEILDRIVGQYKPDWVFSTEPIFIPGLKEREFSSGILYTSGHRSSREAILPDLGVALPTSGSTGSPKLARLSYRNLQANATAICSYLGLEPRDRAITTLPMSYSYGLSVVNSHLLAGGVLLMTPNSFLKREFWNFALDEKATSIAGVPYHHEIMLRTKMLNRELPALRTLTQAGGRLAPERISQMERLSTAKGRRFFVMYGQTEATARISYVPPEHLREKVGSIGIAIPGGTLSVDGQTGELLYSGPNVMLGYAETREDFCKGDELGGHLRTGDLGSRDKDGYFYVAGRLKRFLKVYGNRVNLDEMETLLGRYAGAAAACFGDDDQIRIALEAPASEELVTGVLRNFLKLHPSSFRVMKMDSLPRLPNSKIDYQSLARIDSL